MKKILTLLLLTFLLFSCSKEKKIETKIEKSNFFVETQKLSKFAGKYKIRKTWKIKASSEITLNSKASWRVWKINVKFWDKIKSWKNLISLTDTIANYKINLQKTNLWIESSKLQYNSNKISLNKQVSDLKINLEKLEKD